MGFQDGFNGGLAGFQYLNDLSQQRRDNSRQDTRDQMVQQEYADRQGQDRQKQSVEQIARAARYLSGIQDPDARNQAYQQILPQLSQAGQMIGLPPLPPMLDASHDGELQALSQLDISGGASSQLPADIQTIQYYQKNPEAFAMQMKLRQASANPFGFVEVQGADGVTRLVQTNKREGGAAEIGPGGVPQGAGAGPMGAPPMGADPAPPSGPMDRGAAMSYVQQAEAANGKPFPTPVRLQMITQLMATGRIKATSPYASRPAEQQAALNSAATEAAKVGVQVQTAPQVAGAEAQVAAAKAKAEADAKLKAEREGKIAQRTQNAGTALDLLDEAEKILPTATGSGLGAMRDAGAAQFGVSTSGAQGAARLKTLAGQLILMQPRMEGPQSDADRLLYAQMAGDLGNEKLPVETRMAALQGMKNLQQKYAQFNASAPQGKQIKRTGTHNGRKVVEYMDGTISYAD